MKELEKKYEELVIYLKALTISHSPDEEYENRLLSEIAALKQQRNPVSQAYIDYNGLADNLSTYFKYHINIKPQFLAKLLSGYMEPLSTSINASQQREVTDEEVSEPIQNALYATNAFTEDQCNNITDGILEYLKDAGFRIIRQ